MHPVLFRIPFLDFPIHSYGVLIVTGFLLGMYVSWREELRLGHGHEEEVLDFAFWALLSGIVGARVVFIIVNWQSYAEDPLRILKFWQGGLVFYGAAIGGFLGFVWYARSRKFNLKTTLRLADSIIVALPLAHVFGRFGCLAAGCCWGAAMYHFGVDGDVIADLPAAARFPEGSLAYSSLLRSESADVITAMKAAHTTMPLFPSQLVEAFGESIVFMLLLLIRSRKWFHGQVLLSYGILYPILRFSLEFFRGDAERGIGFMGLSTSQLISLGVATCSLIAIFVLRKKNEISVDAPAT